MMPLPPRLSNAQNQVEAELRTRGISVLEEIPLDPRFFRWTEPNRRPVTNIALRRAMGGIVQIFVDDDVAFAGGIRDQALLTHILRGPTGNGWQQLDARDVADVEAALDAVTQLLGLDGLPPRLPDQDNTGPGEGAGAAQTAGGHPIGPVPIEPERLAQEAGVGRSERTDA